MVMALPLLLSGCGDATAEPDSVPLCSTRYTESQAYTIVGEPVKDKAPGWREALASWNITRQWGLKDRVEYAPIPGTDIYAMRVSYPEGSINPANEDAPRGGAGFNTVFDNPVQAACLRYRVLFPESFAFARGGKMPGLYGGENASGCHEDGGQTGFSTRYMWRDFGRGTLYAYTPTKENKCGERIGLGNWTFPRGIWTTIEQEVVLNDVGEKNGILRVWVDGKQVIDETERVIRTKEDIQIEGIFFSTFFGGRDPSWASPKDQHAFFADFQTYFPAIPAVPVVSGGETAVEESADTATPAE